LRRHVVTFEFVARLRHIDYLLQTWNTQMINQPYRLSTKFEYLFDGDTSKSVHAPFLHNVANQEKSHCHILLTH